MIDYNSVGYAAATVSNGAYFSTGTDYLANDWTVTGNMSLAGTDFTISFWFLADAWSSYGNWLINKRGGGGAREFQIVRYNAAGNLAFVLWDNATTLYSIDASVTPSLDTAYHVVCRWNNTTKLAEIIVDNGTPVTATHTGLTIGVYSNNMTIGAAAWGPTDASLDHHGWIDEACIYKRVLTDSEVAWLYNSGSGRTYTDL